MHPLPGGHRQDEHPHCRGCVGPAVACRTLAGAARRIDLRSGASGAEPRRLRNQILSERIGQRTTMNAITRTERAQFDAPTVTFLLDGREVTGSSTDTLLEIADREGVEIPRLCYMPGMDAVGNCRSCMVEIKGERVLAPSCCRAPQNGMEVNSKSDRAIASQKMVLELLLADMPEADYTRHNEVDEWAAKLGVGKPRFAPRRQVAP